MTAKIIQFTGLTCLNLDAASILRNIADENPENAFVITWSNEERESKFYSSNAITSEILMRLNEFIHRYYNGEFK